MYKLELIVSEPKTDKWGEFEVRKTYLVTKDGKRDGVYGVVVQEVDKRMPVVAYEKKGKFERVISRNLNDQGIAVARFTSNQVLNASGLYYELFPILNGTTCKDDVPSLSRKNCIDDQFQNGAILNYEYDKGQYYANDNPPTSGTITMTGKNVFYETPKELAEAIYNAIQTPPGSGTIRVGPYEWSLSQETPANGLPFRTTFRGLTSGNSPIVTHEVVVSWNAYTNGKKDGTTTVVSKLSGGKRRKRTIRGRAASKSYRKQRTGTSTRRLRGRV